MWPQPAMAQLAMAQPRMEAALERFRQQQLEFPDKAAAKRNYNEDKALENMDTPYGPLVKTMRVPIETVPGAEPQEPGAAPRELPLKYVCPFALLWVTSQDNPKFVAFLKQHVAMNMDDFKASKYWDRAQPEAQPPARIVIYEDEVRPGNVHRPDKGRAYLAIYWSFLDYPDWFLHSVRGWFAFAFVSENQIAQIAGKDSQLTRHVLKAFFGGGDYLPNFAVDGCVVWSEAPAPPGRAPRDAFWFRAVFCCFLTDADGHHKITMCKGASGSFMCAKCTNVVSKKELQAGSPFVHYTCGDWTKIKGLTPERLLQLMAHLRAQKAILGKGAFDDLQQAAGWNFSEHSLVCSDMAIIADIPDSVFWDWQHSLCSSGGSAQYELNQVLVRVKKINPELIGTLDGFKTNVVFPKTNAQHARWTFEERMVDKRNAHIKAFASEVLSMVVVLNLWAQLTLKPTGHLLQEVECLELLGRILFLLRLGDKVLTRLSLLAQLVQQHHDLFVSLYEEEAKPKLHFMLHIPRLFAWFKKNLSCFVTERKHRQSKKWGAFCYNLMCDTMLRKTLREHLLYFKQPYSVDSVRLEPPGGIHKRFVAGKLQRWLPLLMSNRLLPPGAQPQAVFANQVSCPAGTLTHGDLAVWSCGGSVHAGFIHTFCRLRAEPDETYAIVLVLKNLGGARCSRKTSDTHDACVHLSVMVGVFPYFARGHTVYLVASADAL